jgi:diguanylate cyclase (GGDEF)-like protein
MARDKYEEAVIRDNLFHRRLSDLRNTSITQEHIDALAELNLPTGRPSLNKPIQGKSILTQEERELRRSKRYGRALSVCLVGFRGLDRINKDYGAEAHEKALYQVAKMLILSTRTDVDMVGRYGDDRFIVILPETPGQGALIVGERMRKKFEDTPVEHQWHKLHVSASVGIAHFPGHGTDSQELVAKADLACDIIHDRGGNGVSFCPD